MSARIFYLAFFLLACALPARAMLNIEEVTAPKSGVTAWLVTDHKSPMLTLHMLWRGGSVTDPQGKGGVTQVMARLLGEGAGRRDAKAFQTALAARGVRLSFSAERDSLSARLVTLTGARDAARALLRDALTAPRFDAEALARIKQAQAARIDAQRQNPARLATLNWFALAFADHPYARPPSGRRATVLRLTDVDMRAQHRAHLARDNLIVTAVGDITPRALRRMLDDIFMGLPAQNTLPAIAPAPLAATPKQRVQPRGGPQTTLRFGHGGLAVSDDDFFAALVLNHILGGGGFSARFTEEIREKRGLAYSVHSALLPLARSALWLGAVASSNETIGAALALIRGEMARIATQGVDAETLARAKTHMIGSYALRFDSGGKIASQLTTMQFLGFDRDFIRRRATRIEAVRRADIARVARRLLRPDALILSIVGVDPQAN